MSSSTPHPDESYDPLLDDAAHAVPLTEHEAVQPEPAAEEASFETDPDAYAAGHSDEDAEPLLAQPDLSLTPVTSGEPLELPTVDEAKHNKEKMTAILLAVAVHVVLALLLGLLVVVIPGPPASEITAISAPATQEQAPTSKKIAEPPPQQQVTQLTASMQFTTAASVSAVPMPAVEFDPAATTLDLGTTMGSFDTNFGSAGSGSIMMFGKKIDGVKKIAVVMDVSRSMTRYLPEVVKELRKVGRDSALVLYFGCWMNPAEDLEEKALPVGDERFDKFWQYWQGNGDMRLLGQEYAKLQYDPKKPMPLEDVYKQVAKRKDTFFFDMVSLGNRKTSVYSALMAPEIKNANIVYWFADFQDRVDDATAEQLVKKFKQRNRKLYIHAPHDKGPSLTKVADNMVKPLGGEVTILDIQP